jgi:hypothetical protein
MYQRCEACGEDGIKYGAKVCIYCGTNQKQFRAQEAQFRAQEAAESAEAFEQAAETAGEYKWISVPIGTIAALVSGVFFLDAGFGWLSALLAMIVGYIGYVYSLHIIVLGILAALLFGFAG